MSGPWSRTACAAALFAVAGCATQKPAHSGPPVRTAGPRSTYVSVGGADTTGRGSADPLTDAYPQVIFHHALPSDTTFVNLGSDSLRVGATASVLAAARAVRPTVATVWLGRDDELAQTPAADYGRDLGALVIGLRSAGATRILLATPPDLASFPAYATCRSGDERCALAPDPGKLPAPAAIAASVVAYAEATRTVAQRDGATLVVLPSLAGGDFTGDGARLSTQGQAAVAAAFGRALKA